LNDKGDEKMALIEKLNAQFRAEDEKNRKKAKKKKTTVDEEFDVEDEDEDLLNEIENSDILGQTTVQRKDDDSDDYGLPPLNGAGNEIPM
jgi:hypothetical protein